LVPKIINNFPFRGKVHHEIKKTNERGTQDDKMGYDRANEEK
jgi:hypothetical protein